ncbi:MAG: ABC transporter substrate-binding protein [Pseudorhodoplanes sp.]|uniref:ABC transporter substrate-binding protein n=1 Tax=Pseudorhodoplanes sp. TaxID=1934341 RepID=UPI003D0B01EC
MGRLKVFAAASTLLFCAAAHAQQPVKIGFVAELSGPVGALGQDMYDAFMLVVERNGGKLGGVPVEVLREDSQLKPEVANQIIDKLIEKDRVPIIAGITFSNVMMAVYKKIVDKEVFLIGSNASPSLIAGAQCSPFYFQAAAQNDQRAEAMGRYAADKGYKKIYAMAPNYQAGKDFIAGFKREYKLPLLEEVYTPLNQLDFQAELAQLAAAKPDAVYVFYPGGLGVQFVRQWRQSGLAGKIPLLSTSTVDLINLPALQEAAIGVAHASPWGPDFDNAENKRFVAEFEKRYGRLPSEYAATAYDSALLLDAALAKVQGNVADKKAFMAALKTAEFPSVRGKFKFNHNQLGIQDFYVFDVVKDEKGRYTHKTAAKALADAQDAYHSQCPMK